MAEKSIKFKNFALLQQNFSSLYSNLVLNLHLVYELNNLPCNPTHNIKYIYNGWKIAFDGAGLWGFGNGFPRNVAIFGVDNSSSCHTNNFMNNFLVFGEKATNDINGSFGTTEKIVNINFTKVYTKLYYKSDESYLYVSKTESSHWLGSIPRFYKGWNESEISVVLLVIYNFWVDH